MNSKKLTEEDVRSALGLFKYKSSQKSSSIEERPAPNRVAPAKNSVSIEYCVRKKAGGKTFNYTHHSNSISLFEAELEATKEIEAQGLEIWFIVDRTRN